MNPIILLIKILITLNTIVVVVLIDNIITISGPSFCKVVRTKHPIHLIDIITTGIHWKKGNKPNFIIIPKVNNLEEFFVIKRNEIKYIADPLACIR